MCSSVFEQPGAAYEGRLVTLAELRGGAGCLCRCVDDISPACFRGAIERTADHVVEGHVSVYAESILRESMASGEWLCECV